jgi:hypothetical protein
LGHSIASGPEKHMFGDGADHYDDDDDNDDDDEEETVNYFGR